MADLHSNFGSKSVPQLRAMLTGWGIDFANTAKKDELLDLADRYAVQQGACPRVEETQTPGFSPYSWTVSQLRRFLISQNIAYPSGGLKDDYCNVFTENAGNYGCAQDGQNRGSSVSRRATSVPVDIRRRARSATPGVGRATVSSSSSSTRPQPARVDEDEEMDDGAMRSRSQQAKSLRVTDSVKPRHKSPTAVFREESSSEEASLEEGSSDESDEENQFVARVQPLLVKPRTTATAITNKGKKSATTLPESKSEKKRATSTPRWKGKERATDANSVDQLTEHVRTDFRVNDDTIADHHVGSHKVKSDPVEINTRLTTAKLNVLVDLLSQALECLEAGDVNKAKLLAVEAIVRF